MPRNAAYQIDPWCIREPQLDLSRLGQSESVFALSNGHIGLRGNLDEGDPFALPGSFLNSLYEIRPLPHAESAYGYPEAGQTIVNVTNGKLIRLLVDDEPLDVRYGIVHAHERVLDLRRGILTRTVEWTSPRGARVRIRSERLVSLTQRAIAAICYTVQPVDAPIRVVAQSELAANETMPEPPRDPRACAALERPLVPEHAVADAAQARVVLLHRTATSGLRLAAGMSHEIMGPATMTASTEAWPDIGRCTMAAQLQPGEELRFVKYIGYGWSRQRSPAALHDQVVAALGLACLTGWPGLLDEQRRGLEARWAMADVEIDGDPEIQQALRFALFQLLQAGAQVECGPIAAKGLTGPGYDGHTFWDTETFMLPVLSYTSPAAAAEQLHWRHRMLPAAKERAADLGLAGAAFPWRTINGQECSGYWPAGTAAFHINADIADATLRYIDATGNREFERTAGLDLLVETARLWQSLGHYDTDGQFRIDGVTGPDEYSAITDNNLYTNLMAQQNLSAAADCVAKYPAEAAHLSVGDLETAEWREAASAMRIPYDEQLEIHQQHENFTKRAHWDFSGTHADKYPLFLHYPYFELYRKQVVKQADLLLAMQLRGDVFTAEQKERNFAYYEALTVRDSSLSACTQAVLAAETGHLELAHDYLAETALVDLQDRQRNTTQGLHMAALAGAWTAVVAGFGGMRAQGGTLEFRPRLPPGLSRLVFRLQYRRRVLRLAIIPGAATYELLSGEPLPVIHYGRQFLLESEPVMLAFPGPSPAPRVRQAAHRAPARHRPHPR